MQSLVFFNHFEELRTVFFEVKLTINNKPLIINLDTKGIKIRYKLPKINVNDIVLVFYEKVSRHFWRIAIITRVLPSRGSEIARTIVRIAKTNKILKRPVKKLFAIENTYHDTNQTDNAREQKFRL